MNLNPPPKASGSGSQHKLWMVRGQENCHHTRPEIKTKIKATLLGTNNPIPKALLSRGFSFSHLVGYGLVPWRVKNISFHFHQVTAALHSIRKPQVWPGPKPTAFSLSQVSLSSSAFSFPKPRRHATSRLGLTHG